MRVYIDQGLCGGCGPCVDTCSEVFDLNDDRIDSMQADEVPEFFSTLVEKRWIVIRAKQLLLRCNFINTNKASTSWSIL